MSARLAFPDGRVAGSVLLGRPTPPEIKPPFAKPILPVNHPILPLGKGPPAARLTDKISHLSMLAMLKVGLTALAVAAVAVAFVAAVVLTGGGALAVAAAVGGGMIATAAAGNKAADAVESHAAKEKGGGPLSTPTGAIAVAYPTVFTNKLMAANADLSSAVCSKEPTPISIVSEGSGNVMVGGHPAARQGDKAMCGAAISGKCSPDVFIGGGTQQTRAIDDDLSAFRTVFDVMHYTGLAIVIVTGGWAISGAVASGGVVAGLGAAMEIGAGMFFVGPALTSIGQFGTQTVAGMMGVEEGSLNYDLLGIGGGEAAGLIPVNVFGGGKVKAKASGSKPFEINLNLGGRSAKLYKSATGKDFALPPGLREWNAATAARHTERLNNLNKTVASVYLSALLRFSSPNMPKGGTRPRPTPVEIQMEAPRPIFEAHSKTGESPASTDVGSPRIKFESGTGRLTSEGKIVPASDIPAKPTVEATQKKGFPGTEAAKHEWKSVKPKEGEGDVGGKKTGETSSTKTGKEVHKKLADERRASENFDMVNEPFKDVDGNIIQVPKRTDLKTGKDIDGMKTQSANPDAVKFDKQLILDDKPLGRPVSKDRQEIIRFIRAYKEKTGSLPETIAIQRYDPISGNPVVTELYTPADFLPNGGD